MEQTMFKFSLPVTLDWKKNEGKFFSKDDVLFLLKNSKSFLKIAAKYLYEKTNPYHGKDQKGLNRFDFDYYGDLFKIIGRGGDLGKPDMDIIQRVITKYSGQVQKGVNGPWKHTKRYV